MKHPDPPSGDADIRAYAAWWNRHRPIRVPDDGVRVYDGVYGVTLHRHGPFQAQLFIVAPNRGSPRHAHPNIDSLELGIAGADTFVSDRNYRFKNLICVAPNEFHTAAADEKGGAFISFQKWLNGVAPSSVELDWIGEPIDHGHASQLQSPT